MFNTEPSKKNKPLSPNDSFTLSFPEPARAEPSFLPGCTSLRSCQPGTPLPLPAQPSHAAAFPGVHRASERASPAAGTAPLPSERHVARQEVQLLSASSVTHLASPGVQKHFGNHYDQHTDRHAAGQLHLQKVFFLKVVPEHFAQSPDEV